MKEMPPTGADFFLLDRAVVDAFCRFSESNASILALITWMGFRQATITYDKAARLHGRSGWSIKKKLKLVVDSVTSFSYVPIRFMSYLGFTVAFAGFVYAGLVILNFLRGAPVQGWSSLMVVVLLVGGLQMVMMGVLGEYLWRALDESRRRPRYIIEATTAEGQVAADRAGRLVGLTITPSARAERAAGSPRANPQPSIRVSTMLDRRLGFLVLLAAVAAMIALGVLGVGHGGWAQTPTSTCGSSTWRGERWWHGISAYVPGTLDSSDPWLGEAAAGYDFAYPPQSAPLCLLLAAWSPAGARVLMTVLNVAAALALAALSVRFAREGRARPRVPAARTRRRGRSRRSSSAIPPPRSSSGPARPRSS